MIIYSEHGELLYTAIEEAGHSLYQLDGIWVSSNDEEVQAIIDAFDEVPASTGLLSRLSNLLTKRKYYVNT
jgi:hypothetical protein